MTEVRYFHDIDLMLNQLLQARVQGVDSLPEPAAGNAGWIVFRRSDGRLYLSTGTTWQLKATDADALQNRAPGFYLDRANHVGSQLAETISDLAATVAQITAFEHVQAVPQAVVTVTHGLGYRPGVTAFALDFAQQYSEFQTEHLDENTVRVSMDQPQACVLLMS